MIIVKQTSNPFAQRLELGWVLLDEEIETVVAFFYDEKQACIAADALNQAKQTSLPGEVKP